MTTLSAFLAGANTLGYLVAALLFLRAHRKTRDSLFGSFSAAFALLAVNQLVTGTASLPADELPWIYTLRLVAFTVLIVAIVTKNFRRNDQIS